MKWKYLRVVFENNYKTSFGKIKKAVNMFRRRQSEPVKQEMFCKRIAFSAVFFKVILIIQRFFNAALLYWIQRNRNDSFGMMKRKKRIPETDRY